jgi:hypothetical protein
MRYWWANQKQTYAAEVRGGFLWCRQRRANGARNPFYENVRMVAPGDLIFGYHAAEIRAVGMVLSRAREAPLPVAGREAGGLAGVRGWLLDVAWLALQRPLHPARYMGILAPLLPELHAPLTESGKGLQGGRLLELTDRLARALLQLAGGTEPAELVNPDWQPHQLRFGFAETAGNLPARVAEADAVPPYQVGAQHDED